MNTPVTLEIARLLKEKGYNEICQAYFNNESLFNSKVIEQDSDDWNGDSYTNDVVSAPTIAEVVMWLWKTHKIWIYIRNFETLPFCSYILQNGESMISFHNGNKGFKTPAEAYQEAVLHTLKNLI